MKFFRLLVPALVFGAATVMAGEFVYYSDKPEPEPAGLEIPYQGTRRQIERADRFYFHLRYPAVKPDAPDALTMRVTFGNETIKPFPVRILAFGLEAEGKALACTPEFYDEARHKMRREKNALKSYEFKVPPSIHREIIMRCKASTPPARLKLVFKAEVTVGEEKETVDEGIELYQGLYHRGETRLAGG